MTRRRDSSSWPPDPPRPNGAARAPAGATCRARSASWTPSPGRPPPATVIRLQGDEAGTARLLQELPRARWAHIATHGFFADPSAPLRADTRPQALHVRWARENIGAGLHNPLVLSGMCSPGPTGRGARDDKPGARRPGHPDRRGHRRASPFQDLELVVLSACETGRGMIHAGGGEGVFGLQRPFHLAGPPNIIASLSQVNDPATADT